MPAARSLVVFFSLRDAKTSKRFSLPREIRGPFINNSMRRNGSRLSPGKGATSLSRILLHEPAMADDDRLAGQRVGLERGKEQRRLGDVIRGGEFTVHRVL